MGTELDIEVNQYQVQVSCMLMAVLESGWLVVDWAPRCNYTDWEQQLDC